LQRFALFLGYLKSIKKICENTTFAKKRLHDI
jgi:hypothetical protein